MAENQFLATEDGEFNGNIVPENDTTPVAALEDRDVDWVDVTGWGVFDGHAIPVAVARKIAERINLYHAHRVTLNPVNTGATEEEHLEKVCPDVPKNENIRTLAAPHVDDGETHAEARNLLEELETFHANDAGDRAIKILRKLIGTSQRPITSAELINRTGGSTGPVDTRGFPRELREPSIAESEARLRQRVEGQSDA